MKKVILVMAMMVVVLYVSAGRWYKMDMKGDELIGTKSQIMYVYVDTVDTDVRKFVFGDKDKIWSVTTEKYIFQPNSNYFDMKNHLFGLDCTIGLYDEHGNLLYTYKDYTAWITQLNKMLTPSSNKKKVQEVFDNILEYVMTREGYIRIVAPVVKGSYYSLRVPCFNSRNKKMW